MPDDVPHIDVHVARIIAAEPPRPHHHELHELIWHVAGSMVVEADGVASQLLPGTGAWLPAGSVHVLRGGDGGRYGWLMLEPSACPGIWAFGQLIEVTPLLRHLLGHLVEPSVAPRRRRAESVVFDLLHDQLSVPVRRLTLPRDDRCRAIAHRLLDDPSIGWNLEGWGHHVGASVRTLSRVWVAETGVTFVRWRAQARLNAAIAELRNGVDVTIVARSVGYRSTGAFIRVFREMTGSTPGAYLEGLGEEVDDAPAFDIAG